MQHVRAVLRRAAVERGMKGDEHARDTAIELFLQELREVFTPRLIQAQSDDTLASIFADWVSALPHLGAERRIEALIRDVRLCSVPFLVYRKGFSTHPDPEPVVHDNVVSLHAR